MVDNFFRAFVCLRLGLFRLRPLTYFSSFIIISKHETRRLLFSYNNCKSVSNILFLDNALCLCTGWHIFIRSAATISFCEGSLIIKLKQDCYGHTLRSKTLSYFYRRFYIGYYKSSKKSANA